MSNFSTKNHTSYINVRLVRDAKFFEASGDKPAATYLTFVHTTKGQDADTFVDARVVRGAALMAGLKKGDTCNFIGGELGFKVGKDDEVRGVIYDANVVTSVNLKDRASNADAPTPPAEETAAPDVAGDAPAFD